MDAISLILSALAVGAGAAAKDTASLAVKDAYSELKKTVSKHLAKKPGTELVLQQYEGDQDTWVKPLQKVLSELRAEQDKQLVTQAQHLLRIVHPEQTARGKYGIQIIGGKGITIGDHAHVEQHFGED